MHRGRLVLELQTRCRSRNAGRARKAKQSIDHRAAKGLALAHEQAHRARELRFIPAEPQEPNHPIRHWNFKRVGGHDSAATRSGVRTVIKGSTSSMLQRGEKQKREATHVPPILVTWHA